MGATSATGVGQGSAGVTRGPQNDRTNYVSKLDFDVVYSGTVYSDNDTSITIELPSNVKDLPENLTILVSGKAFKTDKNLDSDGLVESFDINCAKKIDIDFVVVRAEGKFAN